MGVNAFKMMVSFVIIVGMLIIWRVPISWNVLYAIPVLIDLFLICFGISCFLMHFGVFVEDLSYVTSICLRLLFYLTGVFWNIMHRLPDPINSYICHFNPTAFLLSAMRDSILYAKTPHRKLLLFYFVVGLVLSVAGIRKVYQNENTYVKVI
jgi:ABC-type polysaccharide/polyol phosphate export permease